ncbi:beta strand repeat-containing protein [Halorarum salinum]|uniref:Uncharacterized protein n=1 Tax=Halorarum salinum TaxID=2743089 RepID=A0A7D5QJD6_9EURY|nr:surface glycoprotein [Halobaculum salinum]QLG61345.1 hypothetical protein HUG12_06190 [Halobaculum salinum]
MTKKTSQREKARAVILAALMVLSVMVGTVALSGGAAAAANSLTATSSGPYQSGNSVSFEFTPDDSDTDVQVWIDADGSGDYQTSETTKTISSDQLTATETYAGSIQLATDAAEGTGYQIAVVQQGSALSGGETPDSTSGTFEVDNTAPTISDYSVTNPSGQDVTVSVTADEQLSAVSATVSGAEDGSLSGIGENFDETDNTDGTYTYEATYTGSSDGDYTVTLNTAADAAGNDGSSSESGTVSVDTTGPSVTYNSPTDLTNENQPTITVDVTDDGSGVDANSITVTVDDQADDNVEIDAAGTGTTGVSYNSGTLTVDVSEGGVTLDDGDVDVSVSADDNYGNSNSISNTGAFTVDTTGPTIQDAVTHDLDNNGEVDQISLTLLDDTNESTIDAGDFEVAGASVDGVEVGDSVNLSVSGLGVDTAVTPQVNLTANSIEDGVGNSIESKQEYTETSDGAAPAPVDMTGPEFGTYGSGESLDFEVEYSESVSLTNDVNLNLSIPGVPQSDALLIAGTGDSNSNLTFTYTLEDDDGVGSVDYNSTSFELGSEGALEDMSGNSNDAVLDFSGVEADLSEVAIDTDKANPVSVDQPNSETNKTTDGTLDVTYRYADDNPSDVQIVLNDTADETDNFVYDVDDSKYSNENNAKTVTLDLDEISESSASDVSNLEGSYAVKVVVTDTLGNTNSTQTGSDVVIIDDEAPDLSGGLSDIDNTDPATSFNVSVARQGSVDVDPSTIEVNVTESDGTEHVLTTAESGVTYDADADKVEVSGLTYADGVTQVNVSAEDYVGNGAERNGELTFEINDEVPSITSVEAEAGSDEVTVSFSEPVHADDDGLSADDFAYEDVNSGSATQIGSVSDVTEPTSTVTITLDAAVDANDLGNDTISAREGAINDSADTQVDTTTVALDDTTPPAEPDITAGSVTAQNEGEYTVTVTADGDTVDTVNVAVKNSSGDVYAENNSVDISSDSADVQFDLTGLEEGDVTIVAEVTDRGVDETNDASVSTVKDNTSATITEVQADAGDEFLYVTFSEEVTGATSTGAYSFENLSVIDVSEFTPEQNTYSVMLDDSVEPGDFNNENVTVAATSGITDVNGTEADTSEVQLTDDEEPFMISATTENGSDTVELTFFERVYNGSNGALSAENFTYVNKSGENYEIESVDHSAGAISATVTLNSSLTANDIGSDVILGTYDDSQDNRADGVGQVITDDVDITDVELSNLSDGTVQVQFNSSEELADFTATLESEHTMLEQENVDETFDIEDASVEQNGDKYTYTVNYTVPRDGSYELNLESIESVSGTEASDDSVDDHVVVDYEDPHPVDAEIVEADGETTTIAVQFNEPVNLNDREKFLSLEQVGWGSYEITLAGTLPTGDEQVTQFDPDDGFELTGDYSELSDEQVVINTIELDFTEGVNFVSVPAEFGSLDIENSEFPNSEVTSIMTYDDGEWHSFNPEKPSDEQDFTELEGGQGYIINVASDDTVDVTVRNENPGTTAEDATPGDQQLEEGWNLVGHWQEGSQSTDVALGTISESSSTNVWGQNSAGKFSYESVSTFEPGEAYWVFVEDDEVYTAAEYEIEKAS